MSDRIPITWRCEISDKRMRPYGKPMTKACGFLNWQNTTKFTNKPTKSRPWLGVCKNCKRKKRLNRGNTNIWETIEDAKEHCMRNNEHIVIPEEEKSNDHLTHQKQPKPMNPLDLFPKHYPRWIAQEELENIQLEEWE